jgi:transposase-like protein
MRRRRCEVEQAGHVGSLVGEEQFINEEGPSDMTHPNSEDTPISEALEALVESGLDGMADAMQILFNEAMKIERAGFLRAEPYERTGERRGYANGFKPKQMKSRVGGLRLQIPQVRDSAEPFYPQSLDRGLRSERALKLAIAEMYVHGVSTRKVQAITEKLCGTSISSTEVSRAAALLDEELESWRQRPLGKIRHLILDARYEKVRHGGSVIDCAVLIAMGVRDDDGKRSILGVSVSLSEAEVHWRGFLESLQERGLHGVRTVTSDDHKGLKAALAARLTGVKWQRCQFHLQRNASGYVPRHDMREGVAADIRSIFNAADYESAHERLARVVAKYRKTAPALAQWMEQNLAEGLTVFDEKLSLPESARRRLRTTNGLERVNKEVKRRTRVTTLFPNEKSVLRLVSAILMEISEEWETGRIYITVRKSD